MRASRSASWRWTSRTVGSVGISAPLGVATRDKSYPRRGIRAIAHPQPAARDIPDVDHVARHELRLPLLTPARQWRIGPPVGEDRAWRTHGIARPAMYGGELIAPDVKVLITPVIRVRLAPLRAIGGGCRAGNSNIAVCVDLGVRNGVLGHQLLYQPGECGVLLCRPGLPDSVVTLDPDRVEVLICGDSLP